MSGSRKFRRSITQAIADGTINDQPIPGRPDTLGRKNAYQCDDCGGYTVTVDVDHGVTPMFLGCRATAGCKGMGRSLMYPKQFPSWAPEVGFEWYRPGAVELRTLAPETRDYVDSGGLMLRAGKQVLAVTSGADDGPGTLRDAYRRVGPNGAVVVIKADSRPLHIKLRSPLPSVAHPLTLDARGRQVRISGPRPGWIKRFLGWLRR